MTYRLEQGPLYSVGDAKTVRVVTGAGEVDMPIAFLPDAMGTPQMIAAATAAAITAADIPTQIASSVASSVAAAMPSVVAQDVPQVVVPASGQTISAINGVTALLLNHTSLIAALNVTLPSSPVDGQRWAIGTGGAVTLLSLSADKPIKGLLTSIAAGGFARYLFSASAGAWFRVG